MIVQRIIIIQYPYYISISKNYISKRCVNLTLRSAYKSVNQVFIYLDVLFTEIITEIIKQIYLYTLLP